MPRKPKGDGAKAPAGSRANRPRAGQHAAAHHADQAAPEIVTAALPAGIGSYQVTFTYTRGTSFTGDLGIDAFCILQ